MNALYLVFAVVALQIGDFVTTALILRSGGTELNPVTARIYNTLGIIPGLCLVKGVVIALFVYYGESFPLPVLAAIVAMYAYVVVHNVNQIRK